MAQQLRQAARELISPALIPDAGRSVKDLQDRLTPLRSFSPSKMRAFIDVGRKVEGVAFSNRLPPEAGTTENIARVFVGESLDAARAPIKDEGEKFVVAAAARTRKSNAAPKKPPGETRLDVHKLLAAYTNYQQLLTVLATKLSDRTFAREAIDAMLEKDFPAAEVIEVYLKKNFPEGRWVDHELLKL